jgi:hypothetical protein
MFEEVVFAPIKLACYAERGGGAHAR